MGTGAAWSGLSRFFDKTTQETTSIPGAPVSYYEEFLGNGTVIPANLTAIDVSGGGLTTPLIAVDVANGVLRLPLDATSEAQESGVSWGDQRPLILNQGLQIEFRAALQVLPTLLSIAVWGLAGDKNAVANTVAESIWFRADGSGAITVESDDTVNEKGLIATGVTVTAGLFKVYRIDCTTITDVRFYIDGVRVAASTTFSMAQVPGLKLQPYIHIAKASGAGLGVLDIDYIRIWQKRS